MHPAQPWIVASIPAVGTTYGRATKAGIAMIAIRTATASRANRRDINAGADAGDAPGVGAVVTSPRSFVFASTASTLPGGAACTGPRGRDLRCGPEANNAAAASAPAVGNRAAGSLAMPRATTASIAGGIPGPRTEGRGGGRLTWAYIWAGRPRAANGRSPVSVSCRRQARA